MKEESIQDGKTDGIGKSDFDHDRIHTQLQHLASIVEFSHDAILSFGADDVIQTWNAGAERLFGYAQAEAVGKSVEALIIPPQYREERRAKLALLFQGQRVQFPETIRQTRNGQLITVEALSSPIFDYDQKVIAVSVIFRDLTERKIMADELARNQLRYKAVVEDQTELLCRWRSDGTLTLVNNAYAEAFGDIASNLEGRSFYDFIPESDHAAVQTANSTLSSETPITTHTHRVNMADGSLRWIEWTNRLFVSEGPDGELYQGTGRDVTERYLAEERLRESEKRYRDLINNINQGFCLIEVLEDQIGNPVDYRFIEVNATFEGHTGLLNAVGKTAKELVPNLENKWIELYGAVAQTGEHMKFEQGSIAMGRVFEVEAVKVGGVDSRKVALLFADITQRRLIEKSLRDRQAKLQLGLAVANIGLCQIDYASDTITLDMNAAALFELPPYEPMKRVDFYARFHPDERAAITGDIAKIIDAHSSDVVPIDHRLLLPGGRIKWVAARKQIEFDAKGQAVTGLMAVHDVTERVVSAQTQLENAARLRQAAVAAQLTYFDFDVSAGKIRFGHNFSQVMGYEFPGLVDQTIDIAEGKKLLLKYIAEGDRIQVAERLDSLTKAPVSETLVYRVLASDGVERWIETSWTNQVSGEGKVVSALATSINITERKHAEQQVRLLMGEMNHRSKNLLAVILSVVRQTARTGDPATLPERIAARVAALAANQDLLVKNLWKGIDVVDLVFAQLSHYKDLLDTRVTIEGPKLTLSPSAAQGIGMALHELATNAGKYGALSNTNGKLSVQWSIEPGHMFSIRWQEVDGPPVSPPTHSGFGQTVIGRMAEAAVEGRVSIAFDPEGLRWSLTAPLDGVQHRISDG